MARKAMEVEEGCKEYTRRVNQKVMRRSGRPADPAALDEDVLRDMKRELDEPSFEALEKKVRRDVAMLQRRRGRG